MEDLHSIERPSSPRAAASIFSKDIWLGDNLGESLAFARDVRISGWTSVGDKLGGAYIGVYTQDHCGRTELTSR